MNNEQFFNIYLWNVNCLRTKIDEFNCLLNKKTIDIIALNETKLIMDDENSLINEYYNFICKYRNQHGGGVAFFIKKNINFEIIDDLDRFNLEILCIKISLNNEEVFIITCYNPPNQLIKEDVLAFIDSNFQKIYFMWRF